MKRNHVYRPRFGYSARRRARIQNWISAGLILTAAAVVVAVFTL